MMLHRSPRSTRRAAFASFAALAMLILVGAALAAFTSLFALQAQRSRDVSRQAQLRQMLLAGQTMIHARLDENGRLAGKRSLRLPPALEADRATLGAVVIESQDEATLRVRLDARLGPARAQQSLRFSTDGQPRRLIDATLH